MVIGSLNFALYFCCNTAFVCRWEGHWRINWETFAL